MPEVAVHVLPVELSKREEGLLPRFDLTLALVEGQARELDRSHPLVPASSVADEEAPPLPRLEPDARADLDARIRRELPTVRRPPDEDLPGECVHGARSELAPTRPHDDLGVSGR